jgi:hypothetical protein
MTTVASKNQITFFEQLGAICDQRWRERQFDPHALPEIAAGALSELPPHRHVDVDRLASDVLAAPSLVKEHLTFGQPQVCLYKSDRLKVCVIWWLDATTSIHSHAFEGAFTVVSGSSVHSEHEFETARAFGPSLAVGRLRSRRTELLQPGDVRPIVRGERFIHSVFHLDSPTVSIVIRNWDEHDQKRQLRYFPPGLAIQWRDRPFSQEAKERLLMSMLQLDHPRFVDMARDYVLRSDAHAGARALMELVPVSRDPAKQLGPALDALISVHGAELGLLARVCLRRKFDDELAALRKKTRNPDHRHLLALLRAVPRREDFVRLVAERRPEEKAIDLIERWVVELDAAEPEALGIRFGVEERRALRSLLQGDEADSTAVREDSAFRWMLEA